MVIIWPDDNTGDFLFLPMKSPNPRKVKGFMVLAFCSITACHHTTTPTLS